MLSYTEGTNLHASVRVAYKQVTGQSAAEYRLDSLYRGWLELPNDRATRITATFIHFYHLLLGCVKVLYILKSAIHDNTQRRHLKEGTILPERHVCTQMYVLLQNSVPCLQRIGLEKTVPRAFGTGSIRTVLH